MHQLFHRPGFADCFSTCKERLTGVRMGIQVKCPHGHVFKVKDKYAGKKGLCPHCEGQVIVQVPDALHSEGVESAYRRAIADEKKSHANIKPPGTDSSVFDDVPHAQDAGTSGSLLGSSVIRHNVRCSACNESVPMWFAKCPNCGKFMERS